MLSKHSTTKLCPRPVYSLFFSSCMVYVCIYVLTCVCVHVEVHDWCWEHPHLSLSTLFTGSAGLSWTHNSPYQLVLLACLLQGSLSPPSEAGIKSGWQHPPGIHVSYGDCILTVSPPILLSWCFPLLHLFFIIYGGTNSHTGFSPWIDCCVFLFCFELEGGSGETFPAKAQV